MQAFTRPGEGVRWTSFWQHMAGNGDSRQNESTTNRRVLY